MAEPTRREEPFQDGNPTEVEDARFAPVTVFEDTPLSSAATVRESPSSVPGGAGIGFASLPPELGERYRLERQLRAEGGEATLFNVTEIGTGETRVLKLYRRFVVLRGEALLRIQSIDPAHVVQLVDHGQLEDGRWYEVLERIETGNLVEYRSTASPTENDLEEVVSELAAAIAAFHRAGLAHHDIKPENILVRTMEPLDLVLGDFGLSVVSDNSTYYATNRNATIAYQAPETMRQVGGGTRDYWALGLTIAMLATGKTPYAGLNDHAILDQHYNQVPPPVIESMSEGRLKQLCRGLTRYDPRTRWSEREIRSWLRGGSPAVALDESRQEPDSTRSVRFNNKHFTTPSALAREILKCWSLTAETIGTRARREQFTDGLILAFGTESLARLTRRWSEQPPRRDRVDAAIVELLLTLDPEAPAVYRATRLEADAIAAAALGDTDDDARFVRDLLDRGLLSAWSRRADCAELGDIDRSWREELGRASQIISNAQAAGVAAPPIEVWTAPLLAVCARRELLADWQQQRDASRPTGDLVPGWYEQIANRSNPADVVGSVLLLSEAQRVQRNDLEARRREREAARRTRRDRICAVVGWAARVAFAASWLLDLPLSISADYELRVASSLLAYGIAFALFRQWRNEVQDRGTIRSRVPDFRLAWLLFSHDDLSAGRRAEAYGVLAFVLMAEWARRTSLMPPLVGLIGGSSSVPQTVVLDGVKLAGLLSITFSVLSYLHRKNEGPPTADEIRRLRVADRRTLIKTGVWTLAWALVIGLPLVASSEESAAVSLMGTMWVPTVVGGMSLLVRGRWSDRRASTTWAIVLLAASAALFAVGVVLSELGWV